MLVIGGGVIGTAVARLISFIIFYYFVSFIQNCFQKVEVFLTPSASDINVLF